MYTHFPVPVFELLQGEGIIKILGIGRIDCESSYLAEIPPFGIILGAYLNRYKFSGFFHFICEF